MSALIPPRPDRLPVEEASAAATWRWWEVVAFTLAGFLAGSVVSVPLALLFDIGTETSMGGEGLAIAAVVELVLAAVLIAWLRSAHPAWWRIVGWPRRGRRMKEAVAGAGLGIAVQVGATVVGGVVIYLLESASGEQVGRPEQVSSDLEAWGVVVFAVFAIAIAPAVEEFVFRGLLFRSIADRHGFWLGALASAVPFGLTHAVPGRSLDVWALMITLMVVGIGLAWIHWWRRNLLANIAAHSLFNVIGVIVVLAEI
jgi:membrane protease YdiL (CAAX protease family)